MPLCSFSGNFAMYDVTPIENLFLLEYMPFAPGDYVRVYLYGLMQCYHPAEDSSLDGIARVLDMKTEQVVEAFKYWEQKGAVIGMSDNPPTYQYVNLRTAMLSGRAQEDDAYQYRDFLGELQSIFGSEKLLHAQEHKKAMEWVEDLHLPREVVLLLVRSKVDAARLRGRSIRYLFKEIDREALKFAEQDIRTEDAAKHYLLRDTQKYQLAQKVLAQYNLRRAPTVAELDMAGKWLSEWGFDEEAVLHAQKETVRSTNPSFAYLDGILHNHRAAAGGDMQTELDERQHVFHAVKQVLIALGTASASPTPQQIACYEQFINAGLMPEVIVKAATQCGMLGRHSFESFERMLAKWQSLGLTTAEAVAQYAQRREETYAVLERCGLGRKPNEADIDQLIDWQKSTSMEVIFYAAECARGTQLPLRYMDKLLNEWIEKGIVSAEEARRARCVHQSAHAPSSSPKELPAQQYTQRTYDDNALSYLAVDITQLPGGDEM